MPVPRHPIDKEEDVAAFLLHNRLECIDEGGREKPRTFRQRKQAEGKDAVDALAEAGDHEGPFRIVWPMIFRFWSQADAVGLNKIGKNLLVSSFLKAIELDCLPQQRIGDRFRIAQNAQTGLALGLHSDVPNRQADEAAARFGLELGPIDDRRLVGIVRVQQHMAKGRLVRLTAGNDGPGSGCPYPSSTIGRCNHCVIGHEPAFSSFQLSATWRPRTIVRADPSITLVPAARFPGAVDLPDRFLYIAASAR